MKYNPELHHRKTIRLKGYDYSQNGVYFITVCIQGREKLFGEIENKKIHLNDTGKMIDAQWNILSNRFGNIRLDAYIIMPDHFHGIIEIVNATKNVGAPLVGALDMEDIINNNQNVANVPNSNSTIGDIIGAFKSITTHEYINGVKNYNWRLFNIKLWQRNYYEQIVRDENALNKIREYIINNPYNWEMDELFLMENEF